MSNWTDELIWTNSADSHLIEPRHLLNSLPEHVQERLPQSVKDPSGDVEPSTSAGKSSGETCRNRKRGSAASGSMLAPLARRSRISSLHELCDDVDPQANHRIRIGAFEELILACRRRHVPPAHRAGRAANFLLSSACAEKPAIWREDRPSASGMAPSPAGYRGRLGS